jgi:cyclophilin family peptidyl-prolyl cis-trans isomerase
MSAFVTQKFSWSAALVVGVCLVAVTAGCARTPVAPPVTPPSLAQKLGWILRLEDQRVLRDPLPQSSLTPTPEGEKVVPAVPVSRPDLVALLADFEPRIRRRAALAIGRVGRVEGVAGLTSTLGDPEPEVRQMAAFALGLIGDDSATDALVLALEDPSPVVKGRAAEALGRIGATVAADPIGAMVARYVTSAFALDPEDLSYPQRPEVEAFRLGLYALADLGAYEVIAAAVLQPDGQPILWWWPVAHALARSGDPRAATPLATLAGVQGNIGVSLAARGLGDIRDPVAIEPLVELLDLDRRDERVIATALRALGKHSEPAVSEALREFVLTRGLDRTLRLETLRALRGRDDANARDIFIELMTASWPPLRAAALRALAENDSDSLMLILSGLDPDPEWPVRVALARALEHVEPAVATLRLVAMMMDEEPRVLPSVLSALVEVEAPEVGTMLLQHLDSEDIVVRKTAATLLGALGSTTAAEGLRRAFLTASDEPAYLARAAIVDALGEIGGSIAEEVLMAALEDPDWAVRVRAAQALDRIAPDVDHDAMIRPAPRRNLDYGAPHLIEPTVSPHVYIETERGTIQIELAVLDAPLTADNFVTLARSGYYDGLSFHRVVRGYVAQGGDPRGDSEGGPGYTLRDEINQLPFLRGTLGMALDWEDTGGSQFFITQSPQPQLDGRYTVFARVVDGMDVVDKLEEGDLIKRVLVWDGIQPFHSR